MPKYTLVKTINADGKSPLFYFEGPSDATEPTDDWITDNSELLQKDTGVRKFKKGNTWEPIASSDGSGGSSGEGGSGGGQFVVTLTATGEGAEITYSADKTIAEIVAAHAAGKTVILRYGASFGGVTVNIDMRCDYAQTVEPAPGMSIDLVKFSGSGVEQHRNATTYYVTGANDGQGEDSFNVTEQIYATETYIPTQLIVTLTMDTSGDNPALVGDKTYGEIKDAQFAGKHVILKGTLEDKGDFAASVIDAVYDSEANAVAITYPNGGQLVFTSGLASGYVTIEVNQQGG